jgi:hypothetical protein
MLDTPRPKTKYFAEIFQILQRRSEATCHSKVVRSTLLRGPKSENDISSTLAASNPASAENMKDLDERYHIIGDMSESFQDQCRYLNSVANSVDTKQKRVRHMMKKNVIFWKIFENSENIRNQLGSV